MRDKRAEETLRETIARANDASCARNEAPSEVPGSVADLCAAATARRMSKAEMKAAYELRVFREFADRAPIAIRKGTIVSGDPPAPDVLCHVNGEGMVAFELKEFCDERLAATMSALSQRCRRGLSQEPVFLRLAGASTTILRKAKRKRYKCRHPIDLLFYTAGRVVIVPDAERRIRDCFSDGMHQFRRVWYMGHHNDAVKCVYDRRNAG